MAGLFGQGAANAYKPTVYTSIQLQTSSQGVVAPVIYGTTRAGVNLIFYNGFTATKTGSGGKGGVLGSASGKGTGNTYKYSANVILGLAEGPIQGVGQAWQSKTPTTTSSMGLTLFTGTYPQAAWGFMTTNYPASARPYTGLAYLAGASYQLGSSAELPGHNFEIYGIFSNRTVYTVATIPTSNPRTITVGSRTWADGTTQSMWVANGSVPGFALTGGAPAAGQYSVSAGVYTFNAADGGTEVTIIWSGKGQDADPSLIVADALSNVNYGAGFPAANVGELNAYTENHAIPGGLTVTVNHSADFVDNLSVYHIASSTPFTCVAASPGPLQYSFAAGTYTFNGADAGKTVEFSYSALDGLDTYQDYVWAAGLFISPAYATQAAASSLLEEIAKFTNSEIVWSSGALKMVPRGDKVLAANGHTYTPPLATQADLDDDDFLGPSGSGGASGSPSDDPVLVTRKRVSDQKNVVQMEALDRTNQYNAGVVEATDQAAVDLYGRRTSGSLQAHLFADVTIARQSVQLVLQREAIRNTYAFKLPATFIWLDPMDLISLTDSRLGLDTTTWERIISIEEQEDGSLALVAEEYASGVSNAEAYAFGSGAGYAANYNVDPGSVNTPIVFEPSIQLATNTGLEIWAALSGASANWGGCDVYVSSDGVTYNYVGRKWGASRMGLTTAVFAAGADPDTVNTLKVSLAQSFGALVAGTTTDADQGNTVCLVGSEMVSFSAATLTGSYAYDLGTYLRRGQFGTTIAAHGIGDTFCRLDEAIFAIPYDKDQIGQTIYVKACSFNLYGGGLQDISVATAYPHVIIGPPPPGTVTDFAITQQGGPVVFTWEELNDFLLYGYDILYGPTTGTVAGATLLTTANRGTEMTHANVPPGTWIFYIRGRDIADQTGPATSATFTVRNFNFIIEEQDSETDWFGTLTNLVKHPSGVLVPQGQNLSSTYGWEVFDQFSPDPFATGTFEALELDSGADGDMRAFLTTIGVAATAYGETGVPEAQGQLRWKTSTGAYDPYVDWISGTITARYVQGQVVLDTTVRAYLTAFDLTLDGPPVTQTMTATIDVAGTAVAWPTPFRNAPVVQVTPSSAGATSGTAESITTLGATIKLWNGAIQVGGQAGIAATGI